MTDTYEGIDFTNVQIGDRIRFVTKDNGFNGVGIYSRTGTVTGKTEKTITVTCEANILGKVARIRRVDWSYREPQIAVTAKEKAEQPSLAAMMTRRLAPNRCIHNHYAAEGVEGDPVAACATKHGETFGAFNAEGAFYAGDCAVDVANETAKEKQEDEDVYWRAMCREHEGEPADTCQECNAEDDETEEEEF